MNNDNTANNSADVPSKKTWKQKLPIILAILLGLGVLFYAYHSRNVSSAIEAVPDVTPEMTEKGDDIASAEASLPDVDVVEQPLNVEAVSADNLPDEANLSESLVQAAELDVQSAETALIAAKNSEDAALIAEKQAQLDQAKDALAKMK